MGQVICRTSMPSADIAESNARWNLEAKGPSLKLGGGHKFVEETRRLICEKNYSPDAVVMHYEKNGWPTANRVSTKTLYRYIYEGLSGDAGEPLLRGKRRRHKGTGGHKRHSRAESALRSISNRPESIQKREEFGHWEMDSVLGCKGKGSQTLMTLTERTRRYGIIRKVKDGTSASIVVELDRLEGKLGSRQFREVFKSLTCDNGSEFGDEIRQRGIGISLSGMRSGEV